MKQARIYFHKDKYFQDKPMADYLMEFLQDQNVLGATLFRGEAGFGESRTIKRPGQLFSFDDPPMVIVFIDEDQKVDKALAALRKRVKTGFIAVSKVEIWK